jgi:hypothetical protein
VSDQNNNLTPLSKEKAFLILAGMVGVLAFIVYGLYPDTKEVPTIPNSGQGNKIQTYDQLLGLGQDINGNGQPAWREIVFGGASTSTDNSTTSNLTIGLARDITVLSSMLTKDQNMDPEIYVSALADNAKSQLVMKDVGQIQISPDNSRSNLKEYGSNAGGTMVLMFANQQKELDDAQTYLTNNDIKTLKSIEDLQKKIKNVCDAMMTYRAPSTAASLHRELLEKCYYYDDILVALAETDTDPTKAMMAVNLYYDMVAGNKELISKFKDFFDSKNIIFGPNDYGRVFNKNI